MMLRFVEDRIDRAVANLTASDYAREEEFSEPAHEPALVTPDSVSWQVFRNPLTLLIGGTAAVILELAEPRVRTGVYDHSAFRTDPMRRLRRTGHATMVTVYAARSRAETLIARVRAMHRGVDGLTPDGRPYRATDPELLTWVHATASFGFMNARHRWVAPISERDQDRFYREGLDSAMLYGATRAPASRAEMDALLGARQHMLEPSPLILEFLELMSSLPLLPRPLAPCQRWLVRAAVSLLPEPIRDRLGLRDDWTLRHWQSAMVRAIARTVDSMVLRRSAACRACRRLGLADDYLVLKGN